MKKIVLLQALIMASLASASVGTWAASFDCQKAQYKAENTICKNPVLNDKDVKLSTTFNILTHLLPMGGRDALRDEQQYWLKQRNYCGTKVSCISSSYNKRQQQLDQLLQERVYSKGPF